MGGRSRDPKKQRGAAAKQREAAGMKKLTYDEKCEISKILFNMVFYYHGPVRAHAEDRESMARLTMQWVEGVVAAMEVWEKQNKERRPA
jgi:hypothetical protein